MIPSVINNKNNKKKRGIKVVWMQSAIYNEEAERKARKNGTDVIIYNRYMMIERRQIFG
jgi:predicted CoA-binding protein